MQVNTSSVRRIMAAGAILCALTVLVARSNAQQSSKPAGPVVVLETVKGTIEFETFPQDAPKTVGRILDLVKRGFYNGQRFHRVLPSSAIQIGDPQSRNMTLIDHWGRSGTGKPIGVAEISKKRQHVRGAVAMANTGNPEDADSQFFIVLRTTAAWDGKYTVFGRVIRGLDVATKIQKSDLLKKASVKE